MKTYRILGLIAISCVILAGAWAVENQSSVAQVEPLEFDASNTADYPDLTNIDLTIIGVASIGKIYMVEGIENTTSVTVNASGTSVTAGQTSYPRLVLHGVFDKLMRAWRNDVISGKSTSREIYLDLRNKAGQRVLRVTFHNALPAKYAMPPFSVDNNTRFMERMEFVYTTFDITN
jgi:phage tail-like protein